MNNNKGMTLVELIVTFSLLLVIIIGMFNLIMEVKFELDNKKIAKELTEYSSMINNDIHYDLLKREPFAIAYKNSEDDIWICRSNIKGQCSEVENVGYSFISKEENLASNSVTKDLSGLNNACHSIYPCAIYAYVSGTGVATETIALNKGNATSVSDDSEEDIDLLTKYGIFYNNVYETIPNQESIKFKDASIGYANDMFTIDFSFEIIDRDKNYGFKIAYPFHTPRSE